MKKLLPLIFLFASICWGESLNDSLRRNLPDTLEVGEVEVVVYNVFDQVKTYTSVEAWVYDLGNQVHIKTKPWVVKKNVFFKTGEKIPQWKIEESERFLRNLIYLADANVSWSPGEKEGVYNLKIEVYDKWTTAAVAALSKESKWLYSLGLTEYNFLGRGHKLGFVYSKRLLRDEYFSMLGIRHFLFDHFDLDLQYTAFSDGFRFVSSYEKPLLHKYDDWSVGGMWARSRQSVFGYLSRDKEYLVQDSLGNRLQELPSLDSESGIPIVNYQSTWIDSSRVQFKKAYGQKFRKEFTLAHLYYRQSNAQDGDRLLPIPTSSGDVFLQKQEYLPLWERTNSALGLSTVLKSQNYRKVRNFRRVKWTEDLLLSYWVRLGVFRNAESLGAGRNEWMIDHAVGFSEYWWDRFYLRASASTLYYLPDQLDGEVKDGAFTSVVESQFREADHFTLVFQTEWEHFYRTVSGRQKTLGGFEGLTGFPDFYYTGQATYWFQVEQRWFPHWEIGTALPVFALYLNGGKAWETYHQVDLNELDYRAGLGLRIGLSKSTLGIVNHINFSWPINGAFEKSWIPTLSIIAKTSL